MVSLQGACSNHYQRIICPEWVSRHLQEVWETLEIIPAIVCLGAVLRPLLDSSQIHCSQQRPGILTRRGFWHQTLGGWDSLHSETHPIAPFTHKHWYLQLGWKLWPLRYITPLCSQPVPGRSDSSKEQNELSQIHQMHTGYNTKKSEWCVVLKDY